MTIVDKYFCPVEENANQEIAQCVELVMPGVAMLTVDAAWFIFKIVENQAYVKKERFP